MVNSPDLLDPRSFGGLAVETFGGVLPRIRLTGELDYGTAPRLRTALARLRGARCVIDCTDLTFIDSLGIGVLVRYSAAVGDVRGRLVLRNLHDNVRRTLEVSGVLDLFEVEHTIAAASSR